MMISLAAMFLSAVAQDAAPTPPNQEQPVVSAAAEPEKICRRKLRSSGEGVTGLKAQKICKTKEEWEKFKSKR